MGLVVCVAGEGSVLGPPGCAVLPGCICRPRRGLAGPEGVWQPHSLYPFTGEAARDSSVTSACLVPNLGAEDAVGLLLALLLLEHPRWCLACWKWSHWVRLIMLSPNHKLNQFSFFSLFFPPVHLIPLSQLPFHAPLFVPTATAAGGWGAS